MAAYTFVFWKGLRLYHSLGDGWEPEEGSEVGTASGVTRKYRSRVFDSPNWEFQIQVPCWFDQLTPISGLSARDTLHLALAQIKKDFISHTGESGPLSWCHDSTRKGDVASSAVAGLRVIPLASLGGSWTPTAGRLILFRDPSSGEGFVTSIVSYAAPNVTCNIPVNIDTGWDVYDITFYWPECQYLGMSQGSPGDATDSHRPRVIYRFGNNADPVIPSALNQDLS